MKRPRTRPAPVITALGRTHRDDPRATGKFLSQNQMIHQRMGFAGWLAQRLAHSGEVGNPIVVAAFGSCQNGITFVPKRERPVNCLLEKDGHQAAAHLFLIIGVTIPAWAVPAP